MNIKLVRFLDFYCGTIICLILSLFKPLINKNNNAHESLLIIELSEMGSAILLAPIIKQIRNEKPELKISFLIFERHKESVELSGLVDNIITIDDRKFLFSFFIALLEIRKLKLKYVLDCELFSRISTIITFFSGARFSSGFVAPNVPSLYRGNIYTHPFVYNNLIHIAENYLGLWRAFSNDDLPYLKEELKISNREIHYNKQIAPSTLVSKRTILFNPDPGLIEIRGWPLESFIELGKILITKDNYEIAIIGLPSASPLAERCCKELGQKCINLAGKTKTLSELLSIYASAKLLVTADSGPAHLAPLANIPAVVLFGPESPIRFAPIGKDITTISSNLSCSPCLSAYNLRNSACNNNVCMKKLTVESVYEEVAKYL